MGGEGGSRNNMGVCMLHISCPRRYLSHGKFVMTSRVSVTYKVQIHAHQRDGSLTRREADVGKVLTVTSRHEIEAHVGSHGAVPTIINGYGTRSRLLCNESVGSLRFRASWAVLLIPYSLCKALVLLVDDADYSSQFEGDRFFVPVNIRSQFPLYRSNIMPDAPPAPALTLSENDSD